jgi:hypothetical protein
MDQAIQHETDIPDIYTNSVRVTASLYEITMEFGLTTPGTDETRSILRIRMSPQQGEALRLLLDKYLRVYGEQFHEILLPDDLVNRLSGIEEGTTDEHEETINTDAEPAS